MASIPARFILRVVDATIDVMPSITLNRHGWVTANSLTITAAVSKLKTMCFLFWISHACLHGPKIRSLTEINCRLRRRMQATDNKKCVWDEETT